MIKTNFPVMLILLALFVTGCDQKSAELEVDKDKPLEEVRQEARQMDNKQLRDMTVKYKMAIMEKEPEINKLMEELQEQPLTGTDVDKLKASQQKIVELTESITALKARYQIYYDTLAKTGADMSELNLSTK